MASELPLYLDTNKIVVVHCWAIWNCYDRHVRAAARNIESEYRESVDFYALDIDTDDGQVLSRAWEIRGVPAFVAFRHGSRIDTKYGFSDQPYEQQVREVLGRWTRRNETQPRFD